MKKGKLTEVQIAIITGSVMGLIAIILIYLSFREVRKIGAFEGMPGILKSISGDSGKIEAAAPAPAAGPRVIQKKGGSSASIAAQIRASKKNIEMHEETIALQPELEKQIAKLERDWKALIDVLPEETNFAELQTSIIRGAAKYDIRLDSLTRRDPVPFDPYTNKVALSITGVEATFHDFGNFLYFLYVPLKRFIILQDFSIESGAPTMLPDEHMKVKHKISMSLVTFVGREE